MESVEFDVPILSEGSISDTNWAELKDYDKKGKTTFKPPNAKVLKIGDSDPFDSRGYPINP